MTGPFKGWEHVAHGLRARANGAALERLNEGQRAALFEIATRLERGARNTCRGTIIADEVGMGKTRIAVTVIAEVAAAGGRAAVLIPRGLMYQWGKELWKECKEEKPALIQSLGQYFGDVENREDWSSRNVHFISHGFANWRMGVSTPGARWGLLPAIVAHHRRSRFGKFPPGYGALSDDFTEGTVWRAKQILHHIQASKWQSALEELDRLTDEDGGWQSRLCDPDAYGKDQPNRESLETVVGWGLGRFDLVVIDEAHKSRDGGDETNPRPDPQTGLSRLLGRVVHLSDVPARLALTATPMALHPIEWIGTLQRVGVIDPQLKEIRTAIETYSSATRDLQALWRTHEHHRGKWLVAAAAYKEALGPYVLRRGKSEERAIIGFRNYVGAQHEHRTVRPTRIDPASLSHGWKAVVMAAEGLSANVSGVDAPSLKNLRLTLGNGHGLSNTVADATERPLSPAAEPATGLATAVVKRHQRAAFWRSLIRTEAGIDEDAALFQHPQIQRAVDLIEADIARGEKVLVFGRYSRPMAALHDLLNARAKFRSASDPASPVWPTEFLNIGEKNATGKATVISGVDQFAAEQLGLSNANLLELSANHTRRYRDLESQRAWLQRNLMKVMKRATTAPDPSAWGILSSLAHGNGGGSASDQSAALVRALWELLNDRERRLVGIRDVNSAELATGLADAFKTLREAATDPENDDTDAIDSQGRSMAESAIKDLLHEEFGSRRGAFARLLEGDTRYPTRRLIQAAFNRPHSFPRVLIAQSVVGREGLNLHEACRIVLLLHHEWNPGVVEQQIGRVDRLNSRWEAQMTAALAASEPAETVPRIEVRTLVFGGTYDEHHWSVLDQRWRDLRAQLHGVVIPPEAVGDDPGHRALAVYLNSQAPRFTPGSRPSEGPSEPRKRRSRGGSTTSLTDKTFD